jgi:hypothetical protein
MYLYSSLLLKDAGRDWGTRESGTCLSPWDFGNIWKLKKKGIKVNINIKIKSLFFPE